MGSPRAGFRHSQIKPRRSATACVEVDDKVVMSVSAVCRKVCAKTRGVRLPLSASSLSASLSLSKENLLSVWGGQNYFFLFSFLCLIWHVIERYG